MIENIKFATNKIIIISKDHDNELPGSFSCLASQYSQLALQSNIVFDEIHKCCLRQLLGIFVYIWTTSLVVLCRCMCTTSGP
jgi:hypothetical protein